MPKLNIGCGHRTIEGYVNADINPELPNLDLICELDSIPAEDGTYSEVFASHCIEHLPVERAKKALREWLRVLAPGGIAVIDTPNIRRNATLYFDGWMADFEILTPAEKEFCSLNGVPNRTLWLNFKVFSSPAKWDQHFWNADPELLTALCLDAGFERAEVAQYSPSLIVKAWKRKE